MKRYQSWVFIGLAVICLVTGLGFWFVPKPLAHMKMAKVANQYQIENVSRKAIEANMLNNDIENQTNVEKANDSSRLENNSEKSMDAKPLASQASQRVVTFDWSNVQTITPDTIQNASSDDLPIMGGVAIPDLQINLPIFKGLSNDNLTYGAGTMSADQRMGEGNYCLASHHVFAMLGASQLLFSPLDNARNGQLIYLTDKANIYVYSIDTIKEVTPQDSSLLYPSKDGVAKVTLVTCTDMWATNRKIVQGSLTHTIAWKDADATIKGYFKQRYNAFQL